MSLVLSAWNAPTCHDEAPRERDRAALDVLFDARMTPHAWPLARTDETWRKPLYTLYMQATGLLIANTRRAS